MEYKKITTILKRYLFEEKMRVLQFYSKNIMNINGIEFIDRQPAAWELETFLLFSIKAEEYQNKKFDNRNINDFVNIINCIKDHQHPKIMAYKGNLKFADMLLIALGSIQFDIQSYNIYKYYRYNYFFTFNNKNVNMKLQFHNNFNIDYDIFLKLGSTLSFFFSLKVNLSPDILKYIVLKYVNATTLLTLSRDNFSSEIDKFANNVDDYLYCVRPSYIFPFIEYNGTINLPLPHCLTRSITDSLLYRLTDSNPKLRDLFGKNVLENYLFDIINESNIFNEVLPEKIYHKKKELFKTPDVMCRKNSNYVFFECKATVPYAKTRCLEQEYVEKEIDKISGAVIQLYKQVYYDFKNEYNFFKGDSSLILNKKNCFGLVVLLEESYIRREWIYQKVMEKLKLNKESEIYMWIVNHIKVCNLYDIERYSFTDTDLINKLKKQIKENSPFNYPLSGDKINSTLKNQNVDKFKKGLIKNFDDISKELIKYGLLKK